MSDMNDDVIQDLKQFIEAIISQSLVNVATKNDTKKLSDCIDSFEEKVDKGFAKVASLIDTWVEPVEEDIVSHERRIIAIKSV